MIDPRLEEFATELQKKYIKAVNKHGSGTLAAAALGVNKSTINNAIKAVKKKAAIIDGYSPKHDLTKPTAPGFLNKRISSLYDHRKPGAPLAMQWVIQDRDKAQMAEALREFVQELCKDIEPLPPTAPTRKHSDADLLSVYVLGDPHFGMRAWAPETGDDFDLEIAERVTKGAVDRLVMSAPESSTALLLNLGDMFHADNQSNQTQSGHQLDVDGRWRKVQQVGLRAMVHAIRRLLDKHERVLVRINNGNHDGHSSYALALMLDCWFHLEPRVEVDLSPAVSWYHQFGKVLIGSTHGDTIKGPDLVALMATDRSEAWGKTAYRYWFVGHVHHSDKKEYRGGTVEYFRTLAARDAWHAGQGYRSGRDMTLIVMHREFGEMERHRCDVAMLPQ